MTTNQLSGSVPNTSPISKSCATSSAAARTIRAPELNGVRDAYGLYDYPGRYKRDDAGKPFTRHKIEAVRVDASTGEGIANAPHLSAGYRFQLTDLRPDAPPFLRRVRG